MMTGGDCHKAMLRCWIIRGIFIGLLMLCVGWWVESYGHSDEVTYISSGGRGCTIFSDKGGLRLVIHLRNEICTGWIFDHQTTNPAQRRVVLTGEEFFLGFGYARNCGPGFDCQWLYIPYYFLVLLFSLASYYVWRKTRPKVAPK